MFYVFEILSKQLIQTNVKEGDGSKTNSSTSGILSSILQQLLNQGVTIKKSTDYKIAQAIYRIRLMFRKWVQNKLF